MSKVTLKNVSKSFDKKIILDDINLEIQDREFCVLVGASGCGKSTLLRMIAGLENTTDGEIYIGEKLMNNVPAKDRNIAMVFQNYALYPHLNVYDNIAFPLKVRKAAKKQIDVKVRAAADILGLDEYLMRKPKELSGGQRQRVALGRAIVREPDVFLMDEPLSNLDAKLRVSMRSEIKKLHDELNTTFIYVTHDQTEALTMGDNIVVLNEGKIQQKGCPKDIFEYPANTFVATFMGANPMNIIHAKIEDDILHFDGVLAKLSDFNKNLLGTRKEVLVGIRPDDICPWRDLFIQDGIKVTVKVDFEETLGANKIVYFKFGDDKVCANIDSKFETSECANFLLKPESFYYFDIDTKKRIC